MPNQFEIKKKKTLPGMYHFGAENIKCNKCKNKLMT